MNLVEKISDGLWEATRENGSKQWFTTKKAAKSWLETNEENKTESDIFEDTRNAYLY
ncbi:MAG: hypothetical protein U0M02_09390 [Acutalibacteraceae bacterium]|nr:hypothetical protein [Acutalibacteraceae bacterium]